MWLFTTQGFYSVVQHKDKPNRLLVRTRVLQDLVDFCGLLPNPERAMDSIDKESGTDYPYRLTIKRKHFQAVLQELGNDIEYTNFKDEVADLFHHEQPQGHRCHVLHKIWSESRQLTTIDNPQMRLNDELVKQPEVTQDTFLIEYDNSPSLGYVNDVVAEIQEYMGEAGEVEVYDSENGQVHIVVRSVGNYTLYPSDIRRLQQLAGI